MIARVNKLRRIVSLLLAALWLCAGIMPTVVWAQASTSPAPAAAAKTPPPVPITDADLKDSDEIRFGSVKAVFAASCRKAWPKRFRAMLPTPRLW